MKQQKPMPQSVQSVPAQAAQPTMPTEQMPTMGMTKPAMRTMEMTDPMARPMGEVPEEAMQSSVMGYNCGGLVKKK